MSHSWYSVVSDMWIPPEVCKAMKTAQWHHICLSVRQDGKEAIWYLDGKEIKMSKRKLARKKKLKARSKGKRKKRIKRKSK